MNNWLNVKDFYKPLKMISFLIFLSPSLSTIYLYFLTQRKICKPEISKIEKIL